MKLFYFKDPHGNFGDDLNPWLWSKLIPELLDDDPDELFVGIGTLLNHRIPAGPRKHVFGSGLGYGRPPLVDDRWTFHAVRGPMTAQALGLSADRSVCDSAILLRQVETRRGGNPNGPVGFIATGQTIGFFDWASLCKQHDIRFISCHDSVDSVLDSLLSCRVVLCEAMHGAIVCDALRVPWVPVRCTTGVLASKWQDWAASIGLTYEPSDIPTLHKTPPKRLQQLKHRVKRTLRDTGLWTRMTPPPPRPSSKADCELAGQKLREAALRLPFLSEEACIARLTDILAERLQALSQAHRVR